MRMWCLRHKCDFVTEFANGNIEWNGPIMALTEVEDKLCFAPHINV